MKSAFGIAATTVLATQTNANEWTEAFSNFSPTAFAEALLEIDIYDKSTWTKYMGTNAHHTRRAYQKDTRRFEPLSRV